MSNVLSKDKREQVIALGRLGWSLRRIEAAVHIRRETIGGCLRAAGIPVRAPGGWGRRTPAKPANEMITDSGAESVAITLPNRNRVAVDRGDYRGHQSPWRKAGVPKINNGRWKSYQSIL